MINAQDVRKLLDADMTDPNLVVQQGRVVVVPATELRTGVCRGALPVISRDELLAQSGRREFGDRDLEELASGLNAGLSNLGG